MYFNIKLVKDHKISIAQEMKVRLGWTDVKFNSELEEVDLLIDRITQFLRWDGSSLLSHFLYYWRQKYSMCISLCLFLEAKEMKRLRWHTSLGCT